MRKVIIFLSITAIFFLLPHVVFAQNDPCPNGSCQTGIGSINAGDPASLIKNIFSILLGISGGVAIILIIISGYQMIASQGNPEKVQGARETLTSAITGLLFIIFSVVILELIGVTVLNIPGFSH